MICQREELFGEINSEGSLRLFIIFDMFDKSIDEKYR